MAELRAQALWQAEQEADALQAALNEEDCALFEQHVLGGVPCPLCGLGRLWSQAGTLLCTGCEDMRVPLVDEAMPMEDVSELLGLAEDGHRCAGCSLRPKFEVTSGAGPPILRLCCAGCGWSELAL
ncbi:unnamed protein product [Prorocentrum cordatum]|uniref:RPA-interacting protein C-terminal domain-containing protein n=1 Tax=Prorocentrum cordatum TaxID=2364126 RepID=A0ABN9Y748_9DINO|nr:unnamed protein product [Polarella glacialis]